MNKKTIFLCCALLSTQIYANFESEDYSLELSSEDGLFFSSPAVSEAIQTPTVCEPARSSESSSEANPVDHASNNQESIPTPPSNIIPLQSTVDVYSATLQEDVNSIDNNSLAKNLTISLTPIDTAIPATTPIIFETVIVNQPLQQEIRVLKNQTGSQELPQFSFNFPFVEKIKNGFINLSKELLTTPSDETIIYTDSFYEVPSNEVQKDHIPSESSTNVTAQREATKADQKRRLHENRQNSARQVELLNGQYVGPSDSSWQVATRQIEILPSDAKKNQRTENTAHTGQSSASQVSYPLNKLITELSIVSDKDTVIAPIAVAQNKSIDTTEITESVPSDIKVKTGPNSNQAENPTSTFIYVETGDELKADRRIEEFSKIKTQKPLSTQVIEFIKKHPYQVAAATATVVVVSYVTYKYYQKIKMQNIRRLALQRQKAIALKANI